MSIEERKLEAQERMAIIAQAREFEDLLTRPGWKAIFALQTEWVEDARLALRKVDTADTAKAIDALQRWQLAENFLELEVNFINHTLAKAKEIRGNVTFDEALLMEQVRHEQQSAPHPGTTDPTGY